MNEGVAPSNLTPFSIFPSVSCFGRSFSYNKFLNKFDQTIKSLLKKLKIILNFISINLLRSTELVLN